MNPTLDPVEAELHFYYDTRTPLSARVVAEALLGLEDVLDNSRGVFGALLDAPVRDTKLLVQTIKSGSQDYGLVVRFILGKGRKAEKRIEEIRKFLKLDVMTPSRLTILVLSAAVLYTGYQSCSKDDPARVQIHNSFNTIGGELGLSADQTIELIESLTSPSKQRKIQQGVSRLIHPTGEKAPGNIVIGGATGVKIDKEVVQAIPAYHQETEEPDPVEDFQDEQIVIRALDLDSPTRGWSAIVPRLSDRRLPVHVSPEVDLQKLPSGYYFQADITVVYSTDAHGNRKPKQFIIRRNCGEAKLPLSQDLTSQ